MLWCLLLLLGSSLSSVLGNEDACKDAILETYKIYKDKVDFPKTTGELKELCSYMLDLSKQYVRTYESCKDTLPNGLGIHKDYYPTVFRNVTEFCSSESNVNKALVKDLSCLSNVLEGQSEACTQLANDAVEKDGSTNQYDPLNRCMKNIFKYGCIAKIMGDTCGSSAESAVYEGVTLLKSMNSYCTSYMMMQVNEKLPKISLDDAIKERVGILVGALAWDETFPISFN